MIDMLRPGDKQERLRYVNLSHPYNFSLYIYNTNRDAAESGTMKACKTLAHERLLGSAQLYSCCWICMGRLFCAMDCELVS